MKTYSRREVEPLRAAARTTASTPGSRAEIPRPRSSSDEVPSQSAGWLVLTAADRALAGLDDALGRTSRWQGNSL